jgi:peptidoglycan hydrolase FlgJ
MLEKTAISPLAFGSATAIPKDDPAKIKESAKQFEALLIGQMLKSMRDSEGGWMGTGEDESSSSAMEYATESFAQALASRGGLGLATMVAKGFEKPE